MLQKSCLRTIAAHMVYESAFSKNAKTQLMRFLETASMSQLSIFINEGRVASKEEVISEVPIVVPAVLAASAVGAARVAYDLVYSKAAQACASKPREARRQCMRDYKIRAGYAKVAALKREMTKCNQTNNPKNCRNTFLNHIRRVEKQVQRERAKAANR